MLFYPNSSLCLKKYPRNINHIPVVFFQVCLDFEQNCYSRTASQEAVREYSNDFSRLFRPKMDIIKISSFNKNILVPKIPIIYYLYNFF